MRYWKNPLGSFSTDRTILAQFISERSNVLKLFQVLVSQAFSRSIPIMDQTGKTRTFFTWEAGSRPWSIKKLRDASGMGEHSVRYCLARLEKMGLIKRMVSNKGTIIQVLNYYRFKRESNCGVGAPLTRLGYKRIAGREHNTLSLKENSLNSTSLIAARAPVARGWYLGPEGEMLPVY